MENEYESKLIRTCPKCNETKPLKEFRYKLTRKQAQQQGYAGNVLVTAEGKVCKVCRPKRKSINRMTTKELMNKAASGDVHPFIAKSRIENIKKDARALQKRGRKEGWYKLWMSWMKELLAPLTEDIRRTQHQIRHSEKMGKHERVQFLKVYEKDLQKLKAKMLYDQRTKPREPEFCCWQEYFPMERARELRELFAQIPEKHRIEMRTLPTMVRYIYKTDDERRFKRPQRATPKERLNTAPNKAEPLPQGGAPQPEPKPSTPDDEWWNEI